VKADALAGEERDIYTIDIRKCCRLTRSRSGCGHSGVCHQPEAAGNPGNGKLGMGIAGMDVMGIGGSPRSAVCSRV
jgi:hypothetical protein